MKATDGDADAKLVYSIDEESIASSSNNKNASSSSTSPFTVEADGRVRLHEPLDFERQFEYSLPVRVTDGEFVASARLLVSVLDVNDEAPQFIVNPTQISVEENQPADVLVGQVRFPTSLLCLQWLDNEFPRLLLLAY